MGVISSGPNILAIIGTSMQRGRRHGVALALGVGTGSGIWAILTVTGLTALVTAYAGAIALLKIFGALYLLWLAYRAFRSAAAPGNPPAANAASDILTSACRFVYQLEFGTSSSAFTLSASRLGPPTKLPSRRTVQERSSTFPTS